MQTVKRQPYHLGGTCDQGFVALGCDAWQHEERGQGSFFQDNRILWVMYEYALIGIMIVNDNIIIMIDVAQLNLCDIFLHFLSKYSI